MSDLLYEVKDKIATITLNRPDKLNAFTRDMIDAWAKALSAAQADESVNVIVVTGSGRAFCSGGDVGRMREGEPTALDGKNSLWEGVHRVPKTLETVDKPVIAMVNGLAVGAGMGMCVMCDMRVAAESARFSTGYVRVGLVPGDGDTYFLPRLVGAAKALELLWTADFIEAPKARRRSKRSGRRSSRAADGTLPPPQLWTERVPQGIAEEVEAKHPKADRDAREQGDPRGFLRVRRGRARQHQPPRRRRLRRAQ